MPGAVGSLVARKGIDAVVEMASLLSARDVAFTLRLLGTGALDGAVLGAFADEPDRGGHDVRSRAGGNAFLGAATVVRDLETELLMQDESGGVLAEAVSRLASDRALLGQLRTAAQRSVQALRWELVAERTIGVYHDAIARRVATLGLAR